MYKPLRSLDSLCLSARYCCIAMTNAMAVCKAAVQLVEASPQY